ncbi:hypothetical protein VOLCADRAFT_102710 [Volvox carteri f. nagariensis]|uniref:Uncharacterized protein n=1 Tax=Volvox carteri f. nagariensis TaxID=3068 RepID=D8THK8_VOLCA|nr:uncharacterized protein VOLCADRAFT_102710 [Volvox carteri f. nagariensis]EFJ53087.1 hypothetical protein VOLCADRAFT_102710 [Volvox carteri f. nagariensis]|eukprot:XP_002946092.1 hypothetical protein VOLCADRAFT_102710 [Volvox carteri f. nagariensis]
MSASLLISRRLSSTRPDGITVAGRAHGTSTAPRSFAQIGLAKAHIGVAIAPRPRVFQLYSVSEVLESATVSAPEKTVDGKKSGTVTIKVGKGGNVNSIAGKIAFSAREGKLSTVRCVGPQCINLAAKAIAISRSYLSSDGIDISCKPSYEDLGRSTDDKPLMGVSFQLTNEQGRAPAPAASEDVVEMYIRGDSKPQVVAGALAARIRENRPAVHLTAIGINAVRAAVLTLSKARQYLRKDRKDIRVLPEFIKVQKEDREVSALRFTVLAENVAPAPEVREGGERN